MPPTASPDPDHVLQIFSSSVLHCWKVVPEANVNLQPEPLGDQLLVNHSQPAFTRLTTRYPGKFLQVSLCPAKGLVLGLTLCTEARQKKVHRKPGPQPFCVQQSMSSLFNKLASVTPHALILLLLLGLPLWEGRI
eukprot:854574-Pelagomonas_calceolata.AAC.2